MRTTIRTRLALAHALVFALMAIVLVGGVYALTARSTTAQSPDPRSRVERSLGLPAGTLLGRRGANEPPLVTAPDRRTLRRVAAGVQAQTRSELLGRVLAYSAALVIATTLVTFLVGRALAGRSLRPLRQITARATTLSERDLHEPIALQGPRDELRELADTFDAMLARLDRAFEGQRLFAANASHELRTPLTRIRTKLDVTLADPDVSRRGLEEMGATIRAAVERSSGLTDALLMLARAQGAIRRRSVAMDEVARAVLEDLRDAAASKRLSVSVDLASCDVSGDPVLLEQLVRNLLGNAVEHNVDGGWVDVRTEAETVGRFRVANGGAGIPAASIEELFVPFSRGVRQRAEHPPNAGFGLGLSIVQAVVEAHDGRVIAEAPEAGGLVIEVDLPIAAGAGMSAIRPAARAQDVEAFAPR
jgi:signal transduction histidine kinase